MFCVGDIVRLKSDTLIHPLWKLGYGKPYIVLSCNIDIIPSANYIEITDDGGNTSHYSPIF